MINLKY